MASSSTYNRKNIDGQDQQRSNNRGNSSSGNQQYSNNGQNQQRYNNKGYPNRNQQSNDRSDQQRSNGDQYQRKGMSAKAEKDLQYKEDLKQKWRPDSREELHWKKRVPLQISLKSEVLPDICKEIKEHRNDVTIPQFVGVDEIIESSKQFWFQFASDTATVKSLLKRNVSKKNIEKCLNSVYPIVHQSMLKLMVDFLSFKKTNGTKTEKDLYSSLNLISFVDRLIRKRPLSFLGANDQHLLRETFTHGYGGFENIGSESEQYPLVLQEYISYDEMRLSALLSLSSWSIFVNNGTRKNFGKIHEPGTYQDKGVIVGQVGARLKKEGVMDYLDCVITREENIYENGFGLNPNKLHINSVWSKFWGVPLPNYEEATRMLQDPILQKQNGVELMPIGRDIIFNVSVYKKRMAVTAEILICEANSRALSEDKKAYIHVVGLGLGVWRATRKQEEMFIEAWGDALDNMEDTKNIDVIDFSYIDVEKIKGVYDNQKYKETGITIKFSQRNLHDKVPDNCILVCNYAWDGNSYPGNEFYLEKLCSTGDSAAACSSMVAEVHNWAINQKVHGACMRIASNVGYLRNCEEFVNNTPVGVREASKENMDINKEELDSKSNHGTPADVEKKETRNGNENKQNKHLSENIVKQDQDNKPDTEKSSEHLNGNKSNKGKAAENTMNKKSTRTKNKSGGKNKRDTNKTETEGFTIEEPNFGKSNKKKK